MYMLHTCNKVFIYVLYFARSHPRPTPSFICLHVARAGVDDVDSECALDGRDWDIVVENANDAAAFEKQFEHLVAVVRSVGVDIPPS